MKIKIAIIASLFAAASAHATVTLGFSAGTTNIANGFGSASGVTTAQRVWGILVDSAGDGWDGLASATTQTVDGGTLYTAGATYQPGSILRGTSGTSPIPGGQALSVGGSATDDILFLSGNLSAIVGGQSRLTTLSGMAYSGSMAAGTKYLIMWFDNIAALDGTAVASGTKYGLWGDTTGTTPVDSTILPADGASLTTAANGPAGMFAGVETNKAATLAFVPEPSAALLGAFGVLGLLRRRRN